MYNHEPENYICPFCSLINGDEADFIYSVTSDVIYDNHMVMAFVSSYQWPNNHGNVLIIPRKHFENIYDLPMEYLIEIQRLSKIIALTLKSVYSCDGVSTRQHNEPGGGQDVWHYHLHITPRYEGDNFYLTQRELMPVAERAKHSQKLKVFLSDFSEGFKKSSLA